MSAMQSYAVTFQPSSYEDTNYISLGYEGHMTNKIMISV